jgi:hypothetical protein
LLRTGKPALAMTNEEDGQILIHRSLLFPIQPGGHVRHEAVTDNFLPAT